MKKAFKTVVGLILILALLGTSVFAGTASDNDTHIMPRFNNIANITTCLDITINGKAICATSVSLYSSANCTCTIEMTLQQDDGSGWDDLRTWTISGGNNTDIEKYRYVDSGYDYRVESVTFVYNSDGDLVETATTHSPIWTY